MEFNSLPRGYLSYGSFYSTIGVFARTDIKVLDMSGYHDQRTFDRGDLKQRGDAYLEKPFGPRILTAQVREVLRDAGRPESVKDPGGPSESGPASTARGAP